MNTILKINAIYKSIIAKYGVGSFNYLNVRDTILGRTNSLSKEDKVKVLLFAKEELSKTITMMDVVEQSVSIATNYQSLVPIFNYYILVRDADIDGKTTCCTCGERFFWNVMHAGHFMSSKFLWTKFDERNVNSQCPFCNLGIDIQFKYSLFIADKYGKHIPEELLRKSIKQNSEFHIDIKKEKTHYKKMISKIIKQKGLRDAHKKFSDEDSSLNSF